MMKLHAKIKTEYLRAILNGEKFAEYRHMDKITLEDSETSELYDFEVTGIEQMSKISISQIQKMYPDCGFTKKRKCYEIALGEQIPQKPEESIKIKLRKKEAE